MHKLLVQCFSVEIKLITDFIFFHGYKTIQIFHFFLKLILIILCIFRMFILPTFSNLSAEQFVILPHLINFLCICNYRPFYVLYVVYLCNFIFWSISIHYSFQKMNFCCWRSSIFVFYFISFLNLKFSSLSLGLRCSFSKVFI